jgi:hypothetical protein
VGQALEALKMMDETRLYPTLALDEAIRHD